MCIIAIKNKGIDPIENTTLETMFNNNPDGCGVMLPINNKLHIYKGMMTIEALKTRLSALSEHVDLKNTPIIYHFRITTHGDSSASNTHPFVITRNHKRMARIEDVTNLGMVHNGIIHIPIVNKKSSDTMQFVSDVVYPLYSLNRDFLRNADALELLERQADSKLAFMDSRGVITKIGEFVTDTETGIIYSNTSYKTHRYTSYNYHQKWNDYKDYYESEYSLCSDVIGTLSLMSLYNEDMSTTYIRYADGTTDDPTDYFMSADGIAYIFHWTEGYVIECNAHVIGARFDENKAHETDINYSIYYDTLDETINGINYDGEEGHAY